MLTPITSTSASWQHAEDVIWRLDFTFLCIIVYINAKSPKLEMKTAQDRPFTSDKTSYNNNNVG